MYVNGTVPKLAVGMSRKWPEVGSRTNWNPTGGIGTGKGNIGSIGMCAEKNKTEKN